MRNATAIRWGGRAVLVLSLTYSAYRVGTAEERERGQVIGEEAGGQLLGWAGATAGAALCIGFGVATGGVGLLACGLVGGAIGGIGGSYLGGAIGSAFDKPTYSGGSSSSSSSADDRALMCLAPGATPGAAGDPFGLGGPTQQATLLELLASPEFTDQIQSTDYGAMATWPAR
jgi:hypothetical protein